MFLSRDFFSRSNNFVFHIAQGVPFIISFLFRRQTLQRAQVCNPSKISNCCVRKYIIANVIKNRPNFMLQDISSYNGVNSLILLS